MAGINFVQVFIGFLVLIVSLTVHEAAHAWTASRLGDPTARLLGRVSLNPAVHVDPIGTLLFPLIGMLSQFPIIGWAKPVPVNTAQLRHPRRDFVLIAAAGPFSNLLLAALTAGLFRALVASVLDGHLVFGPATRFAGDLLQTAVVVNVSLAVFNMIPIPPLDGGNVLAGLLPPSMAATFNQFRSWGFIALYALMLSGLLYRVMMPITSGIIAWLLPL